MRKVNHTNLTEKTRSQIARRRQKAADKEEKTPQTWELLKEDINQLHVDSRAKHVILAMMRKKYGGERFYIPVCEDRKLSREAAICGMIRDGSMSPLDIRIAIQARFGLSESRARNIVKQALKNLGYQE